MGSKPKTSQQQGKKGIFGMGPGQSMAMAGNTGLATMEQKQAEQIQQGLKNLGQPSSFKSIGQNVDEVGSKYRRPADVDSYASKMQLLNQALDAGAKTFTGPDGIQRVNFNNTGIKNDLGQTILSTQIPNLNAMAPTLRQLGGDMSRAFTGYNSLQYTDPNKLGINKMEMVKTEGLADVLAKAAIPGSMAFNILKDLYAKGRNLFLPEEEEAKVDIFSSGADATGGTFVPPTFSEQDLRALPIDEQSTTPVSMTSEDFQEMYPFLFNQEDDLSGEDMLYMTDYLSKRGVLPFAYGGTVAPKSGPMSAGIGTLYNTR